MNLTEDQACGAIMDFDRVRRNFCLPRYTPADWWECDVFELTARNTFREYEVKLTVADFENDVKKKKRVYGRPYGAPEVHVNKHELLAAGDPRGPSRFWYVLPVGLIDPSQLPPWAGMIVIHDRGEGHRPSHRWACYETVKAPKLHDQPAKAEVRDHARGVCYYRLHDCLRTIRDRTDPTRIWFDLEPQSELQLEPS